MKSIEKQNKFYRPEIDGLRAFAIFTVVLNHFNESIFPGGYLGVDVFFVISGYVITSSLSRNNKENFSNFLFSFYFQFLSLFFCLLSLSFYYFLYSSQFYFFILI